MQHKSKKKESQKSQVRFEFTEKMLTSFGGTASIFSDLIKKIKLQEFIESNFPIQEISNNSTGTYSKLISLFITIMNGGTRFSHMNLLNRDREIMQKCFQLEKLPSSSTSLTRFWNKFYKQSHNEELLKMCFKFVRMLLSNLEIKQDSVRFDSTVITRYGKQEGAKRGYNPSKKGRLSHQPQIAFSGSGFAVNMWNRSGNVSSRNGIIDFFNQTISQLEDMKITRILADSGYYVSQFIDHLEDKGYQYVVSAPIITTLQWKIYHNTSWTKISEGIDVCEFDFQHAALGWDKKRRYVAVRQETKRRPEATGKKFSIFDNQDEYNSYRHHLMITNDISSTPEEIWNYYKPRSNDENIIENLKNSFGFDAFNLDSFWGTEAVLMTICLIFHNLYVFLLKKIRKTGSPQEKLRTFRMNFLIIPGILGKDGRIDVLRLGVRNSKIKLRFMEIIEIIKNTSLNLYCNAVQVT